jgi:hypothetical protein
VESPSTETVRQNLRFLVDAGLIPSYADSISNYLHSNPGVAPQVGGGVEFVPSGGGALGPLAELPGTWTGKGFNVIWRPFQGGPPNQDHFLELNLTEETLTFEEIPGAIPNRGLRQPISTGLACRISKRPRMQTSKARMVNPRDLISSLACG